MRIQRGIAELPAALPAFLARRGRRAAEPAPEAVAVYGARVRELTLVVAEHLAEFARYRVEIARVGRAAPWPDAFWAQFAEQLVGEIGPHIERLRAEAARLDDRRLVPAAAFLAAPWSRHHRPAEGPPEPLGELGLPVARTIAAAFGRYSMRFTSAWRRADIDLGEPRLHHPFDPGAWPPTVEEVVEVVPTVATAEGVLAGSPRLERRERPHPVLTAFRQAAVAAAQIVGFIGA